MWQFLASSITQQDSGQLGPQLGEAKRAGQMYTSDSIRVRVFRSATSRKLHLIRWQRRDTDFRAESMGQF
jgi:hypothetical protein